MSKTLARIKEWKTTRTGLSETTGLESVDNGIAALVSGFFSKICVTEPTDAQKRFAAFLKRPAADRVYVGRYDSAIEFLHAMKRARAGAGRRPRKPGEGAGKDLINHDALPIINLSRTFDVGYENQDRSRDMRNIGSFKDPETGKPLAELEHTQATLTYSVTFIAAEKETLSLMCNAYAGRMKELLSTAFKAETTLVRVPISLECALMAAKDVSFSDVSSPMNEERLFAAQTTIDVTAEVITAWEVDATQEYTQMSVSLRDWKSGGKA
jgi:hypothetical protein